MLAGGEGAFTVRTIRSAQFSYENAMERLVSLDNALWGRSVQVLGAITRSEDGEGLDTNIKRMRLSTMIDTDCRISVIATPIPHSRLTGKLMKMGLTYSLCRWGVLEL